MPKLLFGLFYFSFFFNDTPPTEIYTLSLHDALPISERSTLTLVSAENPYSRMVLPYYLDRSIAESHVFTATGKVLADWGVTTHLGKRATALDTKANVCTLEDGTTVAYDDCLIATGSSAVRAPVPGADGPGVHSFWTLDQARGVIAQIQPGSHVVMVGAGFIAF